MTNILTEIVDDAKALAEKVESALTPAAKVVETDAEAIGSATLNFIKANGLQDLYQIALTVVAAMVPGASWTAALASIESQAVADGKQIVQGATAIVAGMAQTDLIAAGKLLPPTAAAA
jgi:hypothetical protein